MAQIRGILSYRNIDEKPDMKANAKISQILIHILRLKTSVTIIQGMPSPTYEECAPMFPKQYTTVQSVIPPFFTKSMSLDLKTSVASRENVEKVMYNLAPLSNSNKQMALFYIRTH